MKLEYSGQIFENIFDVKLHENLSSWSRDVPFGRMDKMKLIVYFRDIAKAAKNEWHRWG
jgi:hypothetical protein